MRLLLSLLVFALVSCASSSKSFYMLTAEGPPPSGGGTGVGVGPVTLASYLDRPNLVFQESENALTVAELHRWGGELEDNVGRVTASNLGRELKTGNVRTYPWDTDSGLRYQVTLDIRQLHGTSNGDVILDASWTVYSLPDRSIRTTRSWSANEPLRVDGYDELVAAQSRLLARLAKEIAASMK